jgi:hypothetical protein
MQENRSSAFDDEDEFAPPDREDAKWQVRVLSLVLSEWPKQLSKQEISRELLADKPTWEERDVLARAITDLASASLLRECEVLVLPTRAALHFASLELE